MAEFTRIEVDNASVSELLNSPELAAGLHQIADEVAANVNAPSKFEISTAAGVSEQGAFSQVIMAGEGAIAVEFGSRTTPPLAPLRRALGINDNG